jgi:hypothetical protein
MPAVPAPDGRKIGRRIDQTKGVSGFLLGAP